VLVHWLDHRLRDAHNDMVGFHARGCAQAAEDDDNDAKQSQHGDDNT
jgi:hypothetical protein